MPNYKLSANSLSKLEGVDPLLVMVVKRALSLSEVDFGVSEGVRSLERQKELVAARKSFTMKSYHLKGKAVDVFALDETGKITWELKYYEKINEAFKRAAQELGATITWGGSWKSFVDAPHFQIEGR